ncbi:hypothetical protein AVEN_230412-1, partial [Araneus ventricosus]
MNDSRRDVNMRNEDGFLMATIGLSATLLTG